MLSHLKNLSRFFRQNLKKWVHSCYRSDSLTWHTSSAPIKYVISIVGLQANSSPSVHMCTLLDNIKRVCDAFSEHKQWHLYSHYQPSFLLLPLRRCSRNIWPADRWVGAVLVDPKSPFSQRPPLSSLLHQLSFYIKLSSQSHIRRFNSLKRMLRYFPWIYW